MSAPAAAAGPARLAALEELARAPLDALVVGGGITGAGVALDLALRGLRTGLVERGDWAGETSSASSRLIHGGLRYLEQGQIALVRESCRERALLLDNAAGLVWPERFLFPVHSGDRVGLARMMLGLWLYTALSAPRALGRPRRLGAEAARAALPGLCAQGLRGAGLYLDAATDDARLTLAVVRAARAAGAICASRVELAGVERAADPRRGARAELRACLAGEAAQAFGVEARAVVLCGGPATDELRARAGLAGRWIQPTRGSHIAVPRERLPTDGAVIFTSPVDGRVMFLIPWPRVTVVGTTDLDAPSGQRPRATRAEVRYLLDSANGLAPAAELAEADVLSTWSGLRPLLASSEDPSQRSREERIAAEGPLWTIAGGKLTGYRAMAENLSARLCEALAIGRRGRRSPTRALRLPGALAARARRPAWSSRLGPPAAPGEDAEAALAASLELRYAADAAAVRASCAAAPDGLARLDAETCLGELDWCVAREDALTLVDFCFRRSDLGLNPAAARAQAARIAERMASLAGWSAARRAAELAALEAELALREAWRSDPA